MGYDHLLDETIITLDWPLEKRTDAIWRDSFIPYPKADEVLSHIDQLRKRPRTLRPQGALVAGVPGNGKSALFHEYARRHKPFKDPRHFPTQDNETQKLLLTAPPGNGKSALLQQYGRKHLGHSTPEVEIRPVIIALAPVNGGEGRLLSAILKAIGYREDWDKGSTDSKQRRVLNALVNCRVEIIMIDDINNMLYGGKKKSEALYGIRNISNYLKIPLIFAGSEEARIVLEDEPSIKTRLDVLELPLWTEGHEYCEFLYNLELTLSLRKSSYLWKREKAHLILELSKSLDPDRRPGILFNILKLVKTAAENGLRDGSEQITVEHLKSAAEPCRWSQN